MSQLGRIAQATSVWARRRRFSVRLGRTTILGALDAVIKAHGASSWSVTWETDPGVPTPYRISFHTFDGWGQTF